MDVHRNRTFGRRIGKKLRPRQRDLRDKLLPVLSIDFDLANKNPVTHFQSKVFPRTVDTSGPEKTDTCRISGNVGGSDRAIKDPSVSDLWLEIGFGGGEHLLELAEREPAIGFFGCEPFLNGVVKLLAGIERGELENVRVLAGDAVDLIAILPEASIGRVYLLYPDPWPKPRQRKRRFVTIENLNAIARVLKPGGELRFASDIEEYCNWTKERIVESRCFDPDPHNGEISAIPWCNWLPTRYEMKAKAAGRKSQYFIFKRKF